MEKRVSKLSITTDDLERRENLTKRLNQTATNRLRQRQEQFQDNHDFIANEISQEIKKLHDDLKGIRETRSYDVRNSTQEMNEHNVGMKRKRTKFNLFQKKSKSNFGRKLNRDEGNKKVKFHTVKPSQVISVGNYKTAGSHLFNLTRNEKQSKNTKKRVFYTQHDTTSAKHATKYNERGVRSNEHEGKFVGHEKQTVARGPRGNEHEERVVEHEGTTRENETRYDNHEALPRITKSATQEQKSREVDVHEARNQARKRILGENGRLQGEHEIDSSTQNEEENTINEDIETYMYVPPDGRKRTVYLLPPLEDLLQEASKARYLRIPKRLMNSDDDPERELSIDEIFNKSVQE